jgi:hypothetical protein
MNKNPFLIGENGITVDSKQTDRPSHGIVEHTYGANYVISDALNPNIARFYAKDYRDVSYRILIQTANGVVVLDNVFPAQRRWDVAFYAAMPGDIATAVWYGNVVYFQVIEIPVTTKCPLPTTPPTTSPVFRANSPASFSQALRNPNDLGLRA